MHRHIKCRIFSGSARVMIVKSKFDTKAENVIIVVLAF